MQQAGEAGAAASAEGSSGELSTMDKMAKAMGWLGGFYSRRQVIMRASRNMYDTSPSPLLPRHHRHPPRPPYRCTLHRPTSISFSGRFHCHSFSLFFPFLSPSFPSTHTHTHTHRYMECAEQAGKDNIYKICKLPDTFQSWFLVQQLHVWFCLVRCCVKNIASP